LISFSEWLESRSHVRYVQSNFSRSAGEVPVLVDVGRVDSAWRRDGGYHVPPFDDSPKYRAAVDGIRSRGLAVMPRVGLDLEAMRVGFDDGRHTFAALRDMGEKSVYVSVDASQRDDFAAFFGGRGSGG